jgi:hypothetical protein
VGRQVGAGAPQISAGGGVVLFKPTAPALAGESEDNLFVRDLCDDRTLTLTLTRGRGHYLSPDGGSVLFGESPPSGSSDLYLYRIVTGLSGTCR